MTIVDRMKLPIPDLTGYTFLTRAVETEMIASDLPEPYKSSLRARALRLYHEAANNENERREHGDAPDHMHLTYL